jgi:hypothetical protein
MYSCVRTKIITLIISKDKMHCSERQISNSRGNAGIIYSWPGQRHDKGDTLREDGAQKAVELYYRYFIQDMISVG